MLLIGIAGGTGCGKTTLVQDIVTEFHDHHVCVISQDSYYKDNSHLSYEDRVLINFDHPQSIDFDLMTGHLLALKNGKSISQPVYSFKEHNRTKETILTKPSDVIIVEGILILNNPDLRDTLDLKIYVETDCDERLIRRLKRDITDRGRDLNEVLNRYQTTLKPMHQKYIDPTKKFADLIIPNNTYNNVAIDTIKTVIKNRLQSL